mmetsp:Transcript_24311/g.61254  ORF Transcript_24311/g.61254 Transcript_24311/m.61254 type:complete len:130 (+) Transcript_24311:85-474(+)
MLAPTVVKIWHIQVKKCSYNHGVTPPRSRQCAVQGVTRKEFDHDGIHFFAMNGVDKPILHSVFAARKCEPPPKLVELFEISEGQADYVDLFAGDWVRDALLWKAPKAGNCPEEEEIESVFSPVASHSFG